MSAAPQYPAPPAFSSQPPPLPPPIQPAGMPAKQSTWPTGVSIVCFVLGGLACISGLMGAVASLLGANVFSRLKQDTDGNGGPLGVMQESMGWMAVSGLLGLACGVLCLLVGFAIIKRCASAKKMATIYAVSQIVYALVAGGLTVLMQSQMFKSMAVQGAAGAGALDAFGTAIMVMAFLFSVAWYAAFPIFLLIWFSRESVKSEIATWA